uniref:Uncharacterized protein n=1 Tax=Timema monikensis TaxID=170555 RepID=A0A7R9HX98_9NEOP|nr:unnamed protein product [Timema monikensis]
MLSFQPAIPSK